MTDKPPSLTRMRSPIIRRIEADRHRAKSTRTTFWFMLLVLITLTVGVIWRIAGMP